MTNWMQTSLLYVLIAILSQTGSCKHAGESDLQFKLYTGGTLMRGVSHQPTRICVTKDGSMVDVNSIELKHVRDAYKSWVLTLLHVDRKLHTGVLLMCNGTQLANVDFSSNFGRSFHRTARNNETSNIVVYKGHKSERPHSEEKRFGITRHEIGHALGLSDLYIEDADKVQPNQDEFSVMYNSSITDYSLRPGDSNALLAGYAAVNAKNLDINSLELGVNDVDVSSIPHVLMAKSSIDGNNFKCSSFAFEKALDALSFLPETRLKELAQWQKANSDKLFFGFTDSEFPPFIGIHPDLFMNLNSNLSLTRTASSKEYWSDIFGSEKYYCSFPGFSEISMALRYTDQESRNIYEAGKKEGAELARKYSCEDYPLVVSDLINNVPFPKVYGINTAWSNLCPNADDTLPFRIASPLNQEFRSTTDVGDVFQALNFDDKTPLYNALRSPAAQKYLLGVWTNPDFSVKISPSKTKVDLNAEITRSGVVSSVSLNTITSSRVLITQRADAKSQVYMFRWTYKRSEAVELSIRSVPIAKSEGAKSDSEIALIDEVLHEWIPITPEHLKLGVREHVMKRVLPSETFLP